MSRNTQGERQDDRDSKPVALANLHFLQLACPELQYSSISTNSCLFYIMGHSWALKKIEDPSAAHPQQVLPCDCLLRKNSGNPTDDLSIGATASVVAVQPEHQSIRNQEISAAHIPCVSAYVYIIYNYIIQNTYICIYMYVCMYMYMYMSMYMSM